MTTQEQAPSLDSNQIIEDDETYHHRDQGYVEVTGIWKATQRLEMVQYSDTQEMTVIRYVPAEDGKWIDERAESLEDFLKAAQR